MEVVVDAYTEQERAIGWYCYLENTLQCPFLAACRARRSISPLHVGDEVQVLGMAPDEECEHEMFVSTRHGKDTLCVPLAQLEVVDSNDATRIAVEDWHYWVEQGYEF